MGGGVITGNDEEGITGSSVLYERDREGFTKRGAMKEGQSQRKMRQSTT